jgi:putative oxidoreductase
MALVRRVARPLLASAFIYGGIEAFRDPEPRAPGADKVVGDLPVKIPGIRTTADLVRADAGVKIAAGTLLALGKLPRLSALALSASIIPTTLAGHRFWEEQDPAQKKQQTRQFLKNASMLGGVLLASVDTAGKPSIGWRTRRAARSLRDSVGSSGGGFTDSVSDAASTVSEKVSSAASTVAEKAQSAAAVAAEKAQSAASSAKQALPV